MSDGVDPLWPPPGAKPSDGIDPDWPPPSMDPADKIDPNWAPPEGQPSRPWSAGPSASFSSTAPVPIAATPGQWRSRGWLLALVAGIIGIAVGVVVAVSLIHRGGSNQAAPSESTPTGSARLPTTAPPQVSGPAPTPPAPAAIPPPSVVTLSPGPYGYATVRTKSGKTRCQISTEKVICEAQYTNSPIMEGTRADGAVVTSGGHFEWSVGNLGNAPTVNLDYQTYGALGWTVVAAEDGTRFTNDSTGHGMAVSIDSVNSF